ncbi:MAG: hypothetical protein P1U40_11955 [Coxiellaceae bacterium]|nr:hypothetical protein [Coxiellaceae bacterium]
MRNYAKSAIKQSVGSFMFLRAATEPTWTGSFNALAMDSLMLGGSLLLMKVNPFNKNMMQDSEFDMYWKSAVTMILGMGAGMLSYQAVKGSVNCCRKPEPPAADAYHDMGHSDTADGPLNSPV